MKALLHSEIMCEQIHFPGNNLDIGVHEMQCFNMYVYMLWRPIDIFNPIKKKRIHFSIKCITLVGFFQQIFYYIPVRTSFFFHDNQLLSLHRSSLGSISLSPEILASFQVHSFIKTRQTTQNKVTREVVLVILFAIQFAELNGFSPTH